MNITVDKQPNCHATIRVEIPTEKLQSERQSLVSAFSSQAKIQGFRPGKVPAHIIEKRYGKEIDGELESRLAKAAFQEALKEENLKVLSLNEIKDFTIQPDQSASFQLLLTLTPEFELPEYKGLEITGLPTEVTDEHLDETLNRLRENMADYPDITDRPAEENDLAVIDFKGFVEGKPIEEFLGKEVGFLAGREGHWVKIHEDAFLPGFATQLMGSKPGDELDIHITIPEDFPVEKLHGVSAEFKTTVKELKAVHLPDLDDDFAGKVTGGKSLDELKDMIRERAKEEKEKQSQDHKVQQAIDQLLAQVEMDLPEDLLRSETQSQADQLAQQSMQSGMDEEELTSRQDELFKAASLKAANQLKTHFILQEIADKEEIEVSDQDLTMHLVELAQSQNEDPKTFIKKLQKEDRIPSISNSLRISKTIDLLLEHATIQEAPETTDEPETKEA